MRASEFARRAGRIESASGRGRRFRRRAMRALVKRAGAARIVPNGNRVGHRLPDGSVACLKKRYRTEAAAADELSRIRTHARGDYVPARAYECEWCGGWHLTSRANPNP